MILLLVSSFLMGLFGGVHCLAMCGGAASLACSPAKTPRAALAFNAGRVAGYVLLGAAAGALGAQGLHADELGVPSMDGFRFALRAAAAICMLTVGLHLLGLPSFVKALESIGGPLWRRVAPIAARLLPLRTPAHALAAGALWALMPCGLLYAALAVAASAGSLTLGALAMATFAVGTLPVMLFVTLVASRVARELARGWVRRAAGAVVLAFGLWSAAGLQHQIAEQRPHACCPH